VLKYPAQNIDVRLKCRNAHIDMYMVQGSMMFQYEAGCFGTKSLLFVAFANSVLHQPETDLPCHQHCEHFIQFVCPCLHFSLM